MAHIEQANSIVSERLSRQGLTVYCKDGTWFMADPTLGEVELSTADARELSDQAEQIVSRLRVIEQLSGQYKLDALGDWRSGRMEQAPGSGRGRNAGGFVSNHEREMLERRAEAERGEMLLDDLQREGVNIFGPGAPQGPPPPPRPDWADDTNVYGARDAANLLGVTAETVRQRARRAGIERQENRRWQFTREQVESMRAQQEAEGGEDGAGGESEGGSGGGFRNRMRDWWSGEQNERGRRSGGMRERLGAAASPAMMWGGLFGAGMGLAHSGMQVGQQTLQAVSGFFENTIAMALGSGFGVSGAALARVGGGIVNMFVGGLQAAGNLATSVANVFGDIISAGLRGLGSIAGLAVGAALLGVLVGAVAGVGSALGETVNAVVGSASRAAQEALSGVASVLRDLTQTGREFARQGTTMRGIGGVQQGQDIAALLMGRATGVDIGGMFSTWSMRPEFAGARYAAAGAQFNPNDLSGSVIALTDQIRALPAVLQFPMANAITGGKGAEIMTLLQQPRERLTQGRDMMADLGMSPSVLQRITNQLDSGLNLLSTLTTGMKLDVLDAMLPSINIGINALWGMWREHRADFKGFIAGLPMMIGSGTQHLLQWGASALDWLAKIYGVGERGWNWFMANVWPTLQGMGNAIRDFFGGGSGAGVEAGGADGSTGSTGRAGGGSPGRGGRGAPPGARDNAYRRTNQVLRVGRWAAENPLLALGIGVTAPIVAQMGVRAALSNPFSRSALVGGGIGYAAAGLGGRSTAGQAVAGLGGVVAGAGAGLLMGGPWGAVIGGLSAAVGGLYRLGSETRNLNRQTAQSEAAGASHARTMEARGYLSPEEMWRRVRAGQRIGRPAGSIRNQQPAAVPRALNSAADWMRRQSERFSPDNIRRAIIEGQVEAARQAAANVPTAKVEISASREFGFQIAEAEGLRLWRNIQLVNA